MSKIDYQALREAAEAIKVVATPQKLLAFRMKVTPQVVLALLDEREAAKKRIAELEAREILLPERSSVLHRTDFHEDYQTVMAYKVSEVIAAIRAAGIRIKGE
ncbi:ead/Ea22-like family protein [Escherichia coli]|uniref:ead/Ea22-like family protein n=1 Tax=Escherichia coli TaxID=562 RepID=UPI001330CC69|nr:ead/Ea22-like family protein [Escherichia coli]EHT7747522.1 ead/Ea22-like family protein [Escherichia coli]HEB9120038.1 ead/Ea22-like family protein [Escherichia coli]